MRKNSPLAPRNSAAIIFDPKDESIWLDMLEDRNLSTHTYDPKLADLIFVRVRDKYAFHLNGLAAKIRES